MGDVALHIMAVTPDGVPLARRLGEGYGPAVRIFAPAHNRPGTFGDAVAAGDAVATSAQLGRLLRERVPLLVIAPVAEVIPLLIPHLRDEAFHPPVLAVDTEGRFVVPLLRGARSEADTWAVRLAGQIGATPVVSASLVVGIGAEKGVPTEDFEAAVTDVLQRFGLVAEQITAVATLDRRAAEEGLRTWATARGWPVTAYTAEQLADVQEMPNPSAIVAQAVGTPGVCEPAAMLASGSRTLLVPKQKRGRVTVALARLSNGHAPSPPQSFRIAVEGIPPAIGQQRPDGITPSERMEHAGNEGGEPPQRGRLTVVGIGPGAADLLTLRAIKAIDAADVLVGYSGYLQRLGDRIADKELHGSAIGREIDRVRLASDLAHRGRKVALISSGDAGIYGMAGLMFEELHARGWATNQSLDVEVIPGITAAQAAASLLGAPLANDFAVLSLSDLLRARDTVERRLEALAGADVVLALYNPQSQTRREVFQRACDILGRHRPAHTPVAVVKAAYREGQSIQVGELSHLADMAVDMESLVLVGNSQTGAIGGRMVTARGQGTFGAATPDPERRPAAASAMERAPEPPSHRVFFVGAGPGDAELLTLKGARILASADVVVYAGSLVPRGVLQHVRPGARLHNSATLTLEETHRLLTEAYRARQQVVRLHSGDPSLYGAITEQMALLDEEHIPYEIIPGVSAFQAVAARLGIEYTQPGVVQTVILTRPGGRTGVPANESLEALARHGVTLCIFLSARHVVDVQQALLTSYPPDTPVAVAYRATWPDEELTLGTLADLVEMVQGPKYDRTTLIIVGPSLQRQGNRSHLYDPSYQHLFRPGNRRGSGGASNAQA